MSRLSERPQPPLASPPPPVDDGLCASWLPSHVQVSVLGARGLRVGAGRGSAGAPGDAFAVLQLGRQKLRTAVATDKGGCPRWEAPPAALEVPPGDPEAEALLLRASVWQRALLGPDRFLGAAQIPLGTLRAEGNDHPRRWYKLHSKPGKKEKERGEIQLSLQFTRHSLTASMFDLSAKEKPRSPFGKLKDKMKGRQKYDLESASAIVPSSFGALEDDFGLEGAKKGSKLSKGGFFFKSKLRKSSLSQSNTSLGSDSTLSSASSLGGIAGPETLAPSPSRHSSLSTDRSVRDFLSSPKLTHKRAFSDEASQINVLPESKSVQSLKPSGKEPISRSSLCINGSHIYCEEPSPKPSFLSPAPAPLPPPLPPPNPPDKPDEGSGIGPWGPDSELPPWSSSRGQKGPPKDPPRFIPSPPILAAQEEDKLSVKTIALNKQRGRAKKEEALRAESKPVQIATPLVFSSEVVRVRPHERTPKEEEEEDQEKKKVKSGFFRRRSSSKDSGMSNTPSASSESGEPSAPPSLLAQDGGEEEGGRSGSGGGWFGRQDSKERKPSSHPGLLAAAREFPREPPHFPEDHGPTPCGERLPGSAPQRTTTPELPAAAATATPPPSEWDESFDAFATSRLRPDPGTEDPPGVSQANSVDRTDPSEPQRGSESQGSRRGEARPGSPDLLGFVPEERGPRGSQGSTELAEEGSSNVTLLWRPPCEESADPQDLTRPRESAESGAREELEGEPTGPGGVEWQEAPERTPAGAPAPGLGSSAWSPPAVPATPSFSSSSAVFFSAEGLPVSLADEGQPGELAVASSFACGSNQAPDVEMREAPMADVYHGDLDSEEEALVIQAQARPGAAPLPEEADLNAGRDAEGEEDREDAMGSQEQQGGGVCERSRAETPPPKPPRRFTPLSFQEEAGEALGGRQETWQDQAAPCDEASALEAERLRPPTGGARPPLVANPLPVPKAIIGAGGGSVPHATESLQLAAEPAGANEPRGREVSSGDATPATKEGAGRAEQFETCPLALSMDGLSLSGAKEDASCLGEGSGGQPASSMGMSEAAKPPGLAKLGSLEVTKELPWQREVGGQPSRTLSPSMFFWSAVGEPRVPPAQDRPPLAPPEGRGHLKQEDEEEEGGKEEPSAVGLSEVGPAGSHVSRASPATAPYSEVLAGGSPSKSEASPSWSDDQVIDCKSANFWQAERRERSHDAAAAMTPGNPFAPQLAPRLPSLPSPQNNPFVERPPDVLPAPAAVLQISPSEDPNLRDPCAAPQGLPHRAVAPKEHPALTPALAPILHGRQPLAFSTPSLQGVLPPSEFSFPSPVGGPAVAQAPLVFSQPSTEPSAPSVLPAETWLEEEAPLQQKASPHLVKPISSTTGPVMIMKEEGKEEKPPWSAASLTSLRSSSSSQEKLKPSTTGSGLEDAAALALELEKREAKRDPSDGAAQYYHLTHDELIQLLQKREAELRKEKERVRELENYIDRLLVRIMEQSPTLLQISLGGEAKAAK